MNGVTRSLGWKDSTDGEQMQEKRGTREKCGVEGYKEWTIEIWEE